MHSQGMSVTLYYPNYIACQSACKLVQDPFSLLQDLSIHASQDTPAECLSLLKEARKSISSMPQIKRSSGADPSLGGGGGGGGGLKWVASHPYISQTNAWPRLSVDSITIGVCLSLATPLPKILDQPLIINTLVHAAARGKWDKA